MTPAQERRARRKRQLERLREATAGPAAYVVAISQDNQVFTSAVLRDGEHWCTILTAIQRGEDGPLLTQVPIDITVRRTG